MDRKYIILIIILIVLAAVGIYYAYSSGLGSTKLTIKNISPSDNSQNVALNKSIIVTFTDQIQPGSAYDSIQVSKVNGEAIQITKSINKAVLVIRPANGNFTKGSTYSVTIPAKSLKTKSGSELTGTKVYYFTTKST